MVAAGIGFPDESVICCSATYSVLFDAEVTGVLH
jgi:hypothetical protein